MPRSSMSADALAERYVYDLSGIASVAELTEIRRRNSARAPHDRCASHDFRDADAIMAVAFGTLAGRAPDPHSPADRALVASAWTIVVTDLLTERRGA